jgi:hypothetical protein
MNYDHPRAIPEESNEEYDASSYTVGKKTRSPIKTKKRDISPNIAMLQ